MDFSGDGPDTQTGGEEAFGDASMIAAQGNQVYDLSNYNNPAYPLPKNCDIKVEGMAPGASLIGLKAGGEFLANSAILQSIDYAINNGANVINESFGANVYSDNNARDTVQLFNDAAVRHGITVTVSTGDAGISGTQGSPSTDPKVISAAASTDFQSYQQTGYAGARYFGNGKWVSNNVSALSSGGISQGGQVPDLLAPGEADWALCSTNTAIFTECNNFAGKPTPSPPVRRDQRVFAGHGGRGGPGHPGLPPDPSRCFAVPGAGQAVPHRHRRRPGPARGRAGLRPGQRRRGGPGGRALQGQHRQPARAGQVITSPSQQLLTGSPNAHVSTGLAVTNSGSKTEKVSLGTRSFAQTSSSTQNVALNAASDPTFPYPTNGLPWAYKKTTFHVSSGAARLGVTIAWKGDPEGVAGGSVVRLSLFGPDGTFVTNTRPQGGTTSANFGFVDVAHPQGGTWTAVLYTPTTAAAVPGQPQPFTGNVILNAATQKDVADGSVSPSTLVLGPGQTGHAQLNTSISGTQGDTAESVTLATSGGQHSSVPVVLRPIIPTTSGGKSTFSGTITGGNARAVAPTQTNTYSFNVPKGQKDLNVGVHLTSDPNVLIEGTLIDPDGETVDANSNATR